MGIETGKAIVEAYRNSEPGGKPVAPVSDVHRAPECSRDPTGGYSESEHQRAERNPKKIKREVPFLSGNLRTLWPIDNRLPVSDVKGPSPTQGCQGVAMAINNVFHDCTVILAPEGISVANDRCCGSRSMRPEIDVLS